MKNCDNKDAKINENCTSPTYIVSWGAKILYAVSCTVYKDHFLYLYCSVCIVCNNIWFAHRNIRLGDLLELQLISRCRDLSPWRKQPFWRVASMTFPLLQASPFPSSSPSHIPSPNIQEVPDIELATGGWVEQHCLLYFWRQSFYREHWRVLIFFADLGDLVF